MHPTETFGALFLVKLSDTSTIIELCGFGVEASLSSLLQAWLALPSMKDYFDLSS